MKTTNPSIASSSALCHTPVSWPLEKNSWTFPVLGLCSPGPWCGLSSQLCLACAHKGPRKVSPLAGADCPSFSLKPQTLFRGLRSHSHSCSGTLGKSLPNCRQAAVVARTWKVFSKHWLTATVLPIILPASFTSMSLLVWFGLVLLQRWCHLCKETS